MKPPNSFRNLLSGLPAAPDGTGRVGPTMAAQRARIPQDLEELNAPRRPRMMTQDELVDMAMDVSSPMGMVAGATRKVAAPVARSLVERIPTLYHGTNAEPFFKFLREKMGGGLNKLGVAGYGTDQMDEGFDYLRTKTQNAPSHIITGKGNQLEVPARTATFLRSGDLSLEDAISKLQKHIKRQEDTMAGFKKPERHRRLREDIENSRSTLYNLLTAVDEGIADINRPGSLLELGADVDPQKLLSYDEDLFDQSQYVQDALRDALKLEGPIVPRSTGGRVTMDELQQQTKFNNLLNSRLRTREGSKMLEDAGIQGVTAGSSMRMGTKNYAIFDPDRIAVLRALGLLGLLTGGARGAASPSQEQEPL
jgi:hypothetical protein